jgi:hypothetical protein
MPDRKVLAGGVTGILIYAISIGLEYFGVNISSDVLGLVIAVVSPSVSFLIPPAVKDISTRLDTDLRRVFEERQAETPGLSPPRVV